ncbi:hypothetical protein EVAR_75427_1 [Eumeta japonica]|uniref:Uncharacterized protein n=1 Tax=Eumeta variegata TaxID=151549 RepID=A0A4C1TJV7_EUMVA|nr:hypothetical protein EVAR_75427_1 [Eumeta japonica]
MWVRVLFVFELQPNSLLETEQAKNKRIVKRDSAEHARISVTSPRRERAEAGRARVSNAKRPLDYELSVLN